MTFNGSRRFVGLGIGPIQAGLFLHHAERSGAYAQPVLVDMRAEFVEAIRLNEGRFSLNIARADRLDAVEIGLVTPFNSSRPDHVERIVRAIAHADEVVTAFPSAEFLVSGRTDSPHLLLARALAARRSPSRLVVYCAEERPGAARMLGDAVLEALPAGRRDSVRASARFVDTVIGTMSCVVTHRAEPRSPRRASAAPMPAPITPLLGSAFLVEEFHQILVRRGDVETDDGTIAHPGIPALTEVDDLAPFEAVRLHGQCAIHALAACLGRLDNVRRMSELPDVPGAMDFLRLALVDEAGQALSRRFGGTDPVFAPAGFGDFADDLLKRMVNPFFADAVGPAARDPGRTLAWDGPLTSTIRLGVSQRVPMTRYALGAAAAVASLLPDATGESGDVERLLRSCWPGAVDERESRDVVDMVGDGVETLRRRRALGSLAPDWREIVPP